MLDAYAIKVLNAPLNYFAEKLKKRGVTPDRITLSGFVIGVLSFFLIAMGWYHTGLIFLLANRIMDGLDGALARMTQKTDAGGFLDICLDFIFYAGIAAAFAFSDSEKNAIPSVILIFSFVGTGTSFLAFAIMAEKYDLKSITFPHKSMYYIGGLTEGTETILFFIAMALYPKHFPSLAYLFAALCMITTTTRIIAGYKTLQRAGQNR